MERMKQDTAVAEDGGINSEAPHRCTVYLPAQGWSFAARTGQSILQSAEDAGFEWPSSCRNGTCRTCLCLMHSGTVRYRIEWPGLSRDEKDEGWILPCVAHPTSDVALEVPHAVKV